MRSGIRNPVPGRFAALLATVALTALLVHRSNDPVVLHRYSAGYTVLLTLALVNVVLLWARPRTPSLRTAAVAVTLISSLAVLVDFMAGLKWVTIDSLLVSIALSSGIIIQTGIYDRIKERWPFLSISLKEVTLIAFSLMCAVVLSELALRVFALERLTPKTFGEFQTFMSGRWPRPLELEKPDGVVRIVGLADSFGVVGGPSENYHHLLEGLLRESGVPAEMMNVSVSGNAPKHELQLLEFAATYKPNLVLHSFYVGNDFTTFAENTYQVRGVRIDDEPGVSRWTPENFFLVDFLRNGWLAFKDAQLRDQELQSGVVKVAGYLSKNAYFGLQRSRLPLFRPEQREAMSEVFPILDAIRERAARANAEYAMVINPEHIQLDDRLRTEVVEYFNAENELDFDFPQRLLRQYCESRSIRCLDLLPIFRATNLASNLYTVRDGHYSSTGNQVTAEAIRKFLTDHKLVEGREPSAN